MTKYPTLSAGISIIYQLVGWFGGCRASASVDIYNKGIEGIPAGPDSPFVLIELQNCMHAMFSDIRSIGTSEFDSFFENPAGYSRVLIGELDGTKQFRFAARRAEIAGRKLLYMVYLLGHRQHFVKVQIYDFAQGRSAKMISFFLSQFLTQMHVGEDGQFHKQCHPDG